MGNVPRRDGTFSGTFSRLRIVASPCNDSVKNSYTGLLWIEPRRFVSRAAPRYARATSASYATTGGSSSSRLGATIAIDATVETGLQQQYTNQ